MTLRLVSSPSAIARQAGNELGGALLGELPGGAGPAWPVQRIFAPLLGANAPVMHETWLSDLPLQAGCSENIAWCRTDSVLYGVLELDEADFPDTPGVSALQAASAEAYRRLFRLLDALNMPHL